MFDQATRLREIAERYCERPAQAKPYVITIASGKGGVGKSVIALNLGMRLAELGNATVVVDADENLGNIDVMAGISPLHRLGNVLCGEADIEDALVSVAENLHVVAGDSGNADHQSMTIDQQKQLLQDLAEMDAGFEFVVMDTAAGIGQNVIGSAVQSHETIIVTMAEPTAIMDAYALIKMISLADSLVPLKLIVNAARSAEEADDAATKLQRAVKHFLNRHVHYLGFVPYDTNVSKAIVRQLPIVKEFPHSGASLALNLLAEKIQEQKNSMRIRRFQAA
jgi:flagellar biosynthesis protein FlhG